MLEGTGSTTRRVVAAAAAMAAMAFAGCGDDDEGGGGGGGDDAAAIQELTTKVVTNEDLAARCGEGVTTAFIRAVYGDAATCRKAETPEPDDKPATGAKVSDVQVDGDTATARVTVQGGESPGAAGDFTYARVDGDWKVDELSVGFLRSQLEKSLAQEQGEDAGPLADPEARTCIGKGLQALDDATFRQLAYSAMADRDPTKEFLDVITQCTASTSGGGEGEGDGEVSLLRRQFEEGVSESLAKDGATKGQTTCVTRALRRTISEDEIVAQVRAGSDKPSGDLAAKAARAIADCQ